MTTQGHATYGGNKVYANGETIALTMSDTMEDRFAYAKRIALCLNTHDRLVNALKVIYGSGSIPDAEIAFNVLAETEGVK